jgi:predicted phage terminase large subunit-like protein
MQNMAWTFPSGATVTFSHLNTEDTVYSFQGAQVSAILFDELTHFYESQFWYMLSRLRSESGIAGYVRATTNPDSDSWVAKLIDWYIDEDGYPIAERAGKERYFFRRNDQIFFGKNPQELLAKGAESEDVKTFTFIPATIEDNKILLESDPSYMSNLRSLSEIEKQRLLYGNWKVKQTGNIFKLEDFNNYIVAPELTFKAIFVDTASKDGAKNDYSVIHLWGLGEKGIYDIDQMRGKWKYSELKSILNAFLAKHSDINALYIEDKSAGIPLIQEIKATTSYPVKPIPRHTDKYSRAYQCTGYVESGRVFLNPSSRYYTDFVAELSSFSADKKGFNHDDQVDCMMDAIEQMLIKRKTSAANKLDVSSFLTKI